MKRVLFVFAIMFCCVYSLLAQEPVAKGHNEKGVSSSKPRKNSNITAGQPISPVVKGGKNPGGSSILSISGGINNPSTTTKEDANLSNGMAFNLNFFTPFYSKDGTLAGKTDHFFSVGPNIGGEYFSSNKDYNISGYNPYSINGQTSMPTVSAKGAGSPKSQGFKFEAGAQANFSFGAVTVSPILNAGYFKLKQQAFAITQTSIVNGQTYNYDLYTQAETKTSGIAFIPKLKVAYYLGRFGFYIEGNYTTGPKIINETSNFKSQGIALKDGSYSIDQMILGKNTAQSKSTSYSSMGVNFGVSFALKSKKGYDSWKAHTDMASARTVNNPLYEDKGNTSTNPLAERRVEVLKSNKTGDPNARAVAPTKVKCSCGTDIYGKDEEACKRICQFLKNGTYGSAKLSSAVLTQIKEDYLNGLFNIENGIPVIKPELFKEITKASDGVGQKVSITKAGKSYAFLGNQDDLVKIISIPSARAQECTDCTTRTCNGTTYDCCCVNGFCMCVICIEISTLSPLPEENLVAPNGNNPPSKGHNEKGIKRSENNPQNLSAGSPIGGIVVKGGKNPGGSTMNLTTNSNGEFEFKAKEPGNYKFTFTASKSNSEEKRSYTGGRKNQESNFADPGNPIGGIVVKGGRNPGGQMFNAVSNKKGEIEFKNLKAGNYKFKITSPTNQKGAGSPKQQGF